MKRKYKDILLKDMTYIASFIGTFILFLIVMYLVIKGAGLIKMHLLTSAIDHLCSVFIHGKFEVPPMGSFIRIV